MRSSGQSGNGFKVEEIDEDDNAIEIEIKSSQPTFAPNYTSTPSAVAI